MGDSSASYIHMVHHLIEECIVFNMSKEECMEALSKHANIKPVITSTANIRVMESNYSDALNLYQELAKDEPRDFRPYLCQGIIYTLMRKKEVEKHFDKFPRLVLKNHPYREYFDDNMFATKLVVQTLERKNNGV